MGFAMHQNVKILVKISKVKVGILKDIPIFLYGIMMKKFSVILLGLLLSQNVVIQTAVADANFTQKSTASGLSYQIIQQSYGKKPTMNDDVEIRFTSYNAKGEVLEGTLNGVPVILPISEMFTGLQESLLLMSVGSTYEFDIPAHLGYQEEGKKNKQAVKYRIELLRINP